MGIAERTAPDQALLRGGSHTTVIQPGGPWLNLNLRELWAYRDLFTFLVWRDIKVRYAQTVLGAGWAVLQPVLTMVVFTLVFGNLAGIPSDGVPYPVFSLAGVVLWTFFSSALTGSSNSLVAAAGLISKIYFPRLVIPLAPVAAGLVDLGIAFLVLVSVLLFYGVAPSAAALLMVPLLVLATMLTAAGVGCWLAALNIQYRDIKYVTPFLLQIWMYLSPVVYPLSMVPERYHILYSLNPMTGPIHGFRSYLIGNPVENPFLLLVSAAVSLVLFTSGVIYFRRTERIFADVA